MDGSISLNTCINSYNSHQDWDTKSSIIPQTHAGYPFVITLSLQFSSLKDQ